MKKIFHLLAVIMVIMLALVPVMPVHADVAPPPPPYAADIYPNSPYTLVRMMAEKVEMHISEETSKDFPYGFAKVKAVFQMRNLGSETEAMDVFFPMNVYNCEETADQMNLNSFKMYPPIQDFSASINGIEQPTVTIYQRLKGVYSTDPLETDVPCWVHFPAIFPPGKDITIQVNYLAPPSTYLQEGYISYAYILHTGSEWNDTIGSADITAYMPYEITEANVYGRNPESGIVKGNEISWHFENLNPDINSDIHLSILKPAIWRSIQIETQNVKNSPKDGEAWGRLGKAYKEAFILYPGFRADDVGEKIYQASEDAYQKAVTLKPNDADWHAGFADLLCWKTFWLSIGNSLPKEAFGPCFQQIKQALDINPQNEKANELLKTYNQWSEGTYVDLSGSAPDYKVLTLVPPTDTPIPTYTALPPLPTFTPTRQRTPISTRTPTYSPTLAETATAGVTPTATQKPGNSGFCASAVLPWIVLVVIRYCKRMRT